jgi:hypothetical protein
MKSRTNFIFSLKFVLQIIFAGQISLSTARFVLHYLFAGQILPDNQVFVLNNDLK